MREIIVTRGWRYERPPTRLRHDNNSTGEWRRRVTMARRRWLGRVKRATRAFTRCYMMRRVQVFILRTWRDSTTRLGGYIALLWRARRTPMFGMRNIWYQVGYYVYVEQEHGHVVGYGRPRRQQALCRHDSRPPTSPNEWTRRGDTRHVELRDGYVVVG